MSDKISTQGMGTSGSGLHFVDKRKKEITPMPVHKRNVFTDLEREELKGIFREVMEEYGLIRLDK